MKILLLTLMFIIFNNRLAFSNEKYGFTEIAIVQGLNKITSNITNITLPIDKEITFGRMVLIAKKCWKSPPDQKPENKLFLEIFNINKKNIKQEIFKGWMFSSTPSISSMEHPIYDITVIKCTKNTND